MTALTAPQTTLMANPWSLIPPLGHLDAYISDLEQQIREAQGSTNKRRVFRAMQTGTGY